VSISHTRNIPKLHLYDLSLRIGEGKNSWYVGVGEGMFEESRMISRSGLERENFIPGQTSQPPG
jgi:hypothetical protein